MFFIKFLILKMVDKVFKKLQLWWSKNVRNQILQLLYYFISNLGSTGKSVPGVKTKVIVKAEEDALKTPMLDGGFSPEIGEVRVLIYLHIIPSTCLVGLVDVI